MYVTVLMDVEDIVDPEADDIAGTCADILSEEGVTATMCIVGERARQWRDRDRKDVIASLGRHDIGYHTDYHSVHPTISEYLAPLSLEAGIEEVLKREGPGVRAIEEVFGVSPSCYGGPGNTWGPAVCEGMRRLGVPAFAYAYTSVPAGGPHMFGGIIAYPNGAYLHDGAYHEDAAAEAALERFITRIESDIADGLLWQQAFAGHPTRILHEHFWDDPLFVRGANPPRDRWTNARRKSQADLDNALKNFRRSIRAIRDMDGIELKTIREMNAILGAADSVKLAGWEQDSVWPQIEKRVLGMSGWVVVPEDLDLSRLAAQTQSLLPTLERFVA